VTLEELEKRILELSRIHAERHDEDVKAELKKLRKQIAEMKERLLWSPQGP
jgi:FKBP-type peptidyl-prolyl cis-trans isomerase (trigger factor)